MAGASPAPVDDDRAVSQPTNDGDDSTAAADPTQPGDWPPTEPEGTHLTTQQAIDRVRHLFGRKRE